MNKNTLCLLYADIAKKPKVMENATFSVMVPIKPALTVTGSFSAFSASAFNFKSLRTTSPAEIKLLVRKTKKYKCKKKKKRVYYVA